LSALGRAPAAEAEDVLALLQRKDARFFSEHDWLAALEKRGTISSARLLLDLICDGAAAAPLGTRQLGAIVQFDIQTIYAQMFERGLSARTSEYTNAVLQSAFRQAMR